MKKIIKNVKDAIVAFIYIEAAVLVLGLIACGYIKLLTSGGIYTIIAIAIIVLPIIGMFLLAYIIGKQADEVAKPYEDYLDECKKKCEKGEMTEEEYSNICMDVEAYTRDIAMTC